MNGWFTTATTTTTTSTTIKATILFCRMRPLSLFFASSQAFKWWWWLLLLLLPASHTSLQAGSLCLLIAKSEKKVSNSYCKLFRHFSPSINNNSRSQTFSICSRHSLLLCFWVPLRRGGLNLVKRNDDDDYYFACFSADRSKSSSSSSDRTCISDWHTYTVCVLNYIQNNNNNNQIKCWPKRNMIVE